MRVAALYDIHGNLAALDAVLAEVDADLIVVGGDIVGGEQTTEALERLRARGDVRFVRGNCERALVEPGVAPPGVFDPIRETLTGEQIDFLYGLPAQLTLEVDGLGSVRFCHATPRNDTEIFTILSPDERVRDLLSGVPESVVVCGHTHMQADRRVDEYRIVNAGSVGMPYEDAPGAYWALLGADVELRRTEYEGAPIPESTRDEASSYFESLVA